MKWTTTAIWLAIILGLLVAAGAIVITATEILVEIYVKSFGGGL